MLSEANFNLPIRANAGKANFQCRDGVRRGLGRFQKTFHDLRSNVPATLKRWPEDSFVGIKHRVFSGGQED